MLILASKSPRRKELLEKHNINFITHVIDTNEVFDNTLPLEKALENVAKEKVKPVLNKYPNDVVLGADTIVVIEDLILGKPKDLKDAKDMLKLLSNKTHKVLTSVVIKSIDKEIDFVETTYITFKELDDETINKYLEEEYVLDKAGSYGIQGKAKEFVSSINGSFYNVMGLPVEKVLDVLKDEFNI